MQPLTGHWNGLSVDFHHVSDSYSALELPGVFCQHHHAVADLGLVLVSAAEELGPLPQVEVDVFRAVQKVAGGARDGEFVSFIEAVMRVNLQNHRDGEL